MVSKRRRRKPEDPSDRLISISGVPLDRPRRRPRRPQQPPKAPPLTYRIGDVSANLLGGLLEREDSGGRATGAGEGGTGS